MNDVKQSALENDQVMARCSKSDCSNPPPLSSTTIPTTKHTLYIKALMHKICCSIVSSHKIHMLHDCIYSIWINNNNKNSPNHFGPHYTFILCTCKLILLLLDTKCFTILIWTQKSPEKYPMWKNIKHAWIGKQYCVTNKSLTKIARSM